MTSEHLGPDASGAGSPPPPAEGSASAGVPGGFDVPIWQHLDGVSEMLDVDISHLRKARDTTVSKLNTIAGCLRHKIPPGHPLDVVAFGSLARLEASDASDFDYLLLAHKIVSPKYIRHYREISNEAGDRAVLDLPAATGMFGKVVSASALTQHIGLEEDTNTSHTRRMLVLEESVSLYLQNEHEQLIRNILSRYILDYEEDPTPAPRVPRFLLNDALRYWYQMTVDYQAKRWTELPATKLPGDSLKWGLRFLKLVISRKLAHAGTVSSILIVAHEAKEKNWESVTVDALYQRFELTALDRLAELGVWLAAQSDDAGLGALKRALTVADWFAERLESRDFRSMANAVIEPRSESNPAEFKEAVERSNELHAALMILFFETKLLGDVSRKYLAF